MLHVTIQAQTVQLELENSLSESEEWGHVYGIEPDAIIDQSSVNLHLLPRGKLSLDKLVSVSILTDICHCLTRLYE